MRMIRTIAQIVDRLQSEVAREGLYDVAPVVVGLPHAMETGDATAGD